MVDVAFKEATSRSREGHEAVRPQLVQNMMCPASEIEAYYTNYYTYCGGGKWAGNSQIM